MRTASERRNASSVIAAFETQNGRFVIAAMARPRKLFSRAFALESPELFNPDQVWGIDWLTAEE
jgi:hypothetical protein